MKKFRLLRFVLPLGALFLLSACGEDNPTPDPPNPGGGGQQVVDGELPVIFHVLYVDKTNPQQYIPASIIDTRFNQLNKFYTANYYVMQQNSQATGGSAAIDVKFTKATHDPNGNQLETPGIEWVQYAGSDNLSCVAFMDERTSTAANKPIFWDPHKYINIWVFTYNNASEANVAGYANVAYHNGDYPLPGTPEGKRFLTTSPSKMYGITLNNKYFYYSSTSDSNYDQGASTMFHEMGHYLGLPHAFHSLTESGYSGCGNPATQYMDDDYCDDTPKYDRDAYDIYYDQTVAQYVAGQITLAQVQALLLLRIPCSDPNSTFTSYNIMDYSLGYRTQISTQQKARIDNILLYGPLVPRPSTKSSQLYDGIDQEPEEPVLLMCK